MNASPKYGPPADYIEPAVFTINAAADWARICERGLTFPPTLGPATTMISRGVCLEPVVRAGDFLRVQPVAPDEALIDGALYVIDWDNPETVQKYRDEIGVPSSEKIVIAKFLRYIGRTWYCQCKDSFAPLNGTVVGKVIDHTRPQAKESLACAQLVNNAVTDIVQTTITGPVNIYSAGTTSTLIGSISIPGYANAQTVVITLSGHVDHHFPSAQTSSCVSLQTTTGTTFTTSQDTWIARNPSTSAADAGGGFAIEKTFTVAANTPTTFYLYGLATIGSAVAGAYSNIYNVGIKAEVIKK